MVKVIAHRGARSLAPENTLAAARLGFELGADCWETDVNITKDNELVLFHDQTLGRCTDVKNRFPDRQTQAVRDFYLEEILKLDAGRYFSQTDPFSQIKEGKVTPEQCVLYKNEKIPTLEQGLELTKTLGWIVNLELKSFEFNNSDYAVVDRTIEQIRKSRLDSEQVIISSFNHDWLKRVENKAPHIEVAALVGDSDTEPIDFHDFPFRTYNVNARTITPEQIDKLKSLGKTINVFTINDPEKFACFEDLGVEGIFTDFPQRFV